MSKLASALVMYVSAYPCQ